jgi:hypothetical protein
MDTHMLMMIIFIYQPDFDFVFIKTAPNKSIGDDCYSSSGDKLSKSYGLGTGWISPVAASRCRSGGFPLKPRSMRYQHRCPIAT